MQQIPIYVIPRNYSFTFRVVFLSGIHE